MAETIDLYNRQRKPLGRTAALDEPLPAGSYRLLVTGWIESAKGAFLMVRPKAGDGSQWQAPTGPVLAGETSLAAALRIVQSQLGIQPETKTIRLLSSDRQEKDRLFYDVFRLRSDTKLDGLTVDTDQLYEARWMMPADIARLADEGQLTPYMKNYEDVVYPE